jgi:seryl-tRNA synthetase
MGAGVPQVSDDGTDFLRQLLDRGLLLAGGVPGIYGHSAEFEDVRAALETLLTREAVVRGAERLRFGPLLPRHQLESSGFLASFPHLAGTVYAFEGDESSARAQHERASRHQPWSECQRMTDLALVPAACYPIYPAMAARAPLPTEGVFVEAGGGWVFRHEPSVDPARRQMFRQHELVRIGSPDDVEQWREQWAAHGLALLRGLGLAADLVTASDPFFGRRGRMLARSQRDQALKLEITAPIAGPAPTAVASFNAHRDHFTTAYAITLQGGGLAHSACVGFGHERIVLALLRTHGLAPGQWPAAVRERLRLAST